MQTNSSPLRALLAQRAEQKSTAATAADDEPEAPVARVASPFILDGEPNEGFDAVMVGDVVIATAEASTDTAGPMAGAMLAGKVEYKTAQDIVLRMSNGRLITCDRETWRGWWKSLFRTAAAGGAMLWLVGCPSFGVGYDPDAGEVTGTVVYKWPAGKQPVE